MGWRFRRRVRLAPGLTLNLSRRGASATVGVPGANVHLGARGADRATLGLPGSGIAYSERLGAGGAVQGQAGSRAMPAGAGRPHHWILALTIVAIAAWWLIRG